MAQLGILCVPSISYVVSYSGPLYRLPCSSTMSTYVPASAASQRPADVRTSASSQSLGHCDVSSMYSLPEPISSCRQNQSHGGATINYHRQREDTTGPCRHLYWNRAVPARGEPNRNNPGFFSFINMHTFALLCY